MDEIERLGPWYHRIDLGNGEWTPGTRNQALVYDLYEPYLPDVAGWRVLDLGANAGGLSVEFAKRGAEVTAVEIGETYVTQARYVFQTLGVDVELVKGDIYSCLGMGEFDIVCYVGLSYHLRYPQLALDMLTHLCGGILLASSQTIEGDGMTMVNRARHYNGRLRGHLYGWEPTEPLFIEMLAHAGFENPRLVSTAPHPGESEGNVCGNRSYYIAGAGEPHLLPFVDDAFIGKSRRQQ